MRPWNWRHNSLVEDANHSICGGAHLFCVVLYTSYLVTLFDVESVYRFFLGECACARSLLSCGKPGVFSPMRTWWICTSHGILMAHKATAVSPQIINVASQTSLWCHLPSQWLQIHTFGWPSNLNPYFGASVEEPPENYLHFQQLPPLMTSERIWIYAFFWC